MTTDTKTLSPKNLQAILDNLGDIVICLDEEEKIVSCSKTVQHILKYTEEELLNQKISKIINSYDPKTAAKYIETKALDKSGYNIDVEVSTTILNEFTLCVIRDISNQKELSSRIEEYTDQLEWAYFEMNKAKKEAEKASKAKSAFMASISHEIRTPLNGIMGMTEVLINSDLNSRQENFANTIYSSSELLLSLINDILDFSKIEAGEMTLENIDCDILAINDETISILQEKFHEKELELIKNYDKNIPGKLQADPTRIKQILLNLLGNAIKFTDKGGKITLQTELLNNDNNEFTIKYIVTDTGIGIEQEKHAKIFEQFTQADNSTTRQYGGTGLGLSICKKLVTLMSGEIGLESTVGKGSSFWFTIKT